MARLLVALLVLAGCSQPLPSTPDASSSQPAESPDASATGDSSDGWVSLFDGETLDGWRGYNRADAPSGWRVEDGAIHFAPGGEGGDLITDAVYDDFELELEWKVAPCGNSGIFYTVEESPALRAPWQTGLEMQVLDDACHSDAKYPSHRAGTLYDLYVVETEAVRPGGEWNQVRIVVDDGRIEHWLNGQRVVSARQGSPDWTARVAASKFRDSERFPAFGTRTEGHIGVQDHGDPVWFRNVRVRRL